MHFFAREKPWYKKKKVIIPLGIFVFLLIARVVAVPIIQKQLNNFLADFSPSLYFHMDDLDIHLIRGAYTFDGVTGKIRTQKNNFVTIDKVNVSIAWRELFRGRIVTDIDVSGLKFSYTKDLQKALSSAPERDAKLRKEKAQKAKDTLFPLKVVRVDLRDSNLILDDYPSLEEGKKFQISNIQGRITNLKPEKDFPLSFFNLKATILGNSVFKTTGHLNTLKKPLSWDVDGEIQDFDLTKANTFMKRKVPLTFTKGKLDLFFEAISQNGEMEGYFKPFLKNLDVMKLDENYKGPKHWLIEVVGALGNLVLRTADTHTVATKIPFSSDKDGFHIDKGEALSKVIEHGFQEKLAPGIEDEFEIK